MLTLDDKGGDLFEGWIPEELLKLPEELAFADKALDDPRVLEPFLKDSKAVGRPSTAVATYVRMMYLKFRYQMSYETLVKEVSDSLKWRKFCHLTLNGKVPDDKTLIKLTNRYGEDVVKRIHDTVVRRAVEAKVIRGKKMRVDTTVTESNIHYPTDTGLLADGARVISRTIKKIKEVVKLKTRFRNRTRAIKRRILKMVKFLRGKTPGAKEAMRRSKKEILKMARAVWEQAMKVLEEMRDKRMALKAPGGISLLRAEALQEELKHWVELMRRIIEQTRQVLEGNPHIRDRLVSLFDPGARPIRKGKLFPKTEFGRKVLIQEAEKGLVTDYQVHEGNPPDQSLLNSSVDKHEEIFDVAPGELAADRGFHQPDQDEGLHRRGIRHVSIPVRGRASGHRLRTQRSAWFRRLQRWRAGGEGKMSWLKRKYGLRKTRVRGNAQNAKWIGWGCIVHNLVLLAMLGP